MASDQPPTWCASKCAAVAGAATAKTCFVCTNAEKSAAPRTGRRRAIAAIAHNCNPSAAPLYWKCTWSTMSKPGWKMTRTVAIARGVSGDEDGGGADARAPRALADGFVVDGVSVVVRR